MEFLELAKKRFSTREFKNDEIQEDKIKKILEAAKVAPSACNNQPVKVFVLKSNEAKEKIKKCTTCHFNAPLIMLVCYDKNICWKSAFNGKESGDIDASIVTCHMMLEAFDLGIGSTWVMYFDPKKVIEEFNLNDNLVPVALLPMGYPSDNALPSDRHNQYRNDNELFEIV